MEVQSKPTWLHLPKWFRSYLPLQSALRVTPNNVKRIECHRPESQDNSDANAVPSYHLKPRMANAHLSNARHEERKSVCPKNVC